MAATRWGIVSCGKISSDFAAAIRYYSRTEHEIVCCAARNLSSAQEFASKYNISKAYGSYQELADDPSVDVAYIGSINVAHAKLIEMMLNAKKNVVCEKPICMNVKELKPLLELAKKNRVFFMEAFWTRFFPVMEDFRRELKNIGDVRILNICFGANIEHIERLALKEQGGGATLDLGCYAVMLTNFVFGPDKPIKITASSQFSDQGVDRFTTIAIHFSGGRVANLIVTMNCLVDNTARIFGTEGSLTLPDFWHPCELIAPKKTYKYDLPKSSYDFNFGGSEGLAYEVKCVRECLLKGHKECPLMPHEDSLWIMEALDEVRCQIGLKFPADE